MRVIGIIVLIIGIVLVIPVIRHMITSEAYPSVFGTQDIVVRIVIGAIVVIAGLFLMFTKGKPKEEEAAPGTEEGPPEETAPEEPAESGETESDEKE